MAKTHTLDLFSEPLGLVPTQKQKAAQLTKAQKTFNGLIGRIEKRRAQLAAWEAAIPRYQARHAAELLPLAGEAARLRSEMARRLDRLHRQKGLTQAERRLVADLVAELAADLAAETGDAEMKALYRQYGGCDYDEEEALVLDGMREILEDTLGFDLGEDLDLRSPEAFLERMQARLAEEAARQEAAPQARKTAKQLAREEKLRQEAQRVGQSLREVYRKLASALHPDREADPDERARKTALMQRVNQAYEKKDLLRLLELQLEIEQIDRAALDAIGDERLAHYNKILKEQAQELEAEIACAEDVFRLRYGHSPFARLEPSGLMRELEEDIVRARLDLRDLESDLHALQDIGTAKAWLKAMRHQRRKDAWDDIPF